MIEKIVKTLWLLINGVEFVVFTLLMYLVSYLPKSITTNFYFVAFQYWCRSFVRALGVDLKLLQNNRRKLPKQYILIANHPSAFEDIGIPALFPVFSLAKIEVAKWWIVGRISQAAGTLYVHRESKSSRAQAHAMLISELDKGNNVALYPEGGCKGRRIHHRFHYGAFDVSLKTGVPILPVFIHYESQEDFEWQPPYTLIDKVWHILKTKNSRANYYVFDAIEPKDFQDKDSYSQYVHGLYLEWQDRIL